jgi:hypothetical protein
MNCKAKLGALNKGAPVVTDPCAILPYLRAAYYDLLSGKATSSVGDDSRRQTFHAGNIVLLRDEIAKLEQMCPKSASNPRGGPGHATNVVARALGRW